MISIISFILDNLISNFINHNSLFYPLFTMLSLIIIYPKFNKKDNKYYIYSFILGLIYDITVSDTLFLNAFIFLLLSYILNYIFKKIPYNYLSILIISILTIIYYRLVTYLTLILLNYLNINILILLKSIYSSLILNIIYISILSNKKLIFKKKNHIN